MLDAPVTVGTRERKQALVDSCRRREKVFLECMPIFKAMGTNIGYREKPAADSIISWQTRS